MGFGDIFKKTSFLRPFTARTFPSQEARAKNKELQVLEKRNDIDLMRLEREKRMEKNLFK